MTLSVLGWILAVVATYGLVAVAMARRCRTASHDLERHDQERSNLGVPGDRQWTAALVVALPAKEEWADEEPASYSTREPGSPPGTSTRHC